MNVYDLPSNVGSWFLTDPDCAQYCRKLSPTKYEFTQIVWLDTTEDIDKEYVVTHDVEELADYNIDELECAVSSYYKSLADMADAYGKYMRLEDYLQLIAECAFENESYDISISDIMTWDDCVMFQHQYMLNHDKEDAL